MLHSPKATAPADRGRANRRRTIATRIASEPPASDRTARWKGNQKGPWAYSLIVWVSGLCGSPNVHRSNPPTTTTANTTPAIPTTTRCLLTTSAVGSAAVVSGVDTVISLEVGEQM